MHEFHFLDLSDHKFLYRLRLWFNYLESISYYTMAGIGYLELIIKK